MYLQVIEHVYEKVMNGGSEGGSGAGTPTGAARRLMMTIRKYILFIIFR